MVLLKGVKIENRVTHEIFMIIRRHGLLLFKIDVPVPLLVQALQGGGGGVTKLNAFWTQKVTKLHFFKTPKKAKRRQNL